MGFQVIYLHVSLERNLISVKILFWKQWCVAVIMGVMAFLNFTFVDLSVFPKDSGSAKVKAATRKTIQ